MRVAELWRYPVRSLQGERLERTRVTAGGIEGDRGWAIWDLGTDLGLTARRVPELLFASARLGPDGEPEVTLPDGGTSTGDDELSRWLGRRVELRRADSGGERRYEDPTDPEREDRPWRPFVGADGAFHDSARARVSLVSEVTLGGWDRRRFRANLVLSGAGEETLSGQRVKVGDAILAVNDPIFRCAMVTRAQTDGVERA